jgi:hypothetical protein
MDNNNVKYVNVIDDDTDTDINTNNKRKKTIIVQSEKEYTKLEIASIIAIIILVILIITFARGRYILTNLFFVKPYAFDTYSLYVYLYYLAIKDMLTDISNKIFKK